MRSTTSAAFRYLGVALVVVATHSLACSKVDSDSMAGGLIEPACDQLPTVEEARKVLSEYAHEVEAIRLTPPANDSVHVELLERCSGRALVEITFGTKVQAEEIERNHLVDGKFHGLPIRFTKL